MRIAELPVACLLSWFERYARDLPWRRTRDPYAIWVSEIMLQQTQVKTVIPYWTRFMTALPTISSLAQAAPEKLHKLWEGLGYYTRVRNLQQAARMIMEQHNGQFPTQFGQVLELPGIGRYTAGAICSIAFDQPQPILDGNVIRVLTRAFGIAGNPREKAVNRRLWELAEQLVQAASASSRGTAPIKSTGPPRAVGACSQLNQALMELGALVCTPREPQCRECPLQKHCRARTEGRIAQLPQLPARPATTQRRFVAFVSRRAGKFLVRQRPAGVVNGQLWEFPNIEVNEADGDPQAAALKVLGAPADLRRVCTVRHSITRYRMRLDVYAARMKRPMLAGLANGKWVERSALNQLAFASAHKKIIERLCSKGGTSAAATQR